MIRSQGTRVKATQFNFFFCGSSPRRGQENLYKTQRYKHLFETLYTYLRLEIYKNTFANIEFAKQRCL